MAGLLGGPLKAQVMPVGISDVQLLHAVVRDLGLLRSNTTRAQVGVRRIHVTTRQGVAGVENAVSKTVQYAFVFRFTLSIKALNKRRETSIQGSR